MDRLWSMEVFVTVVEAGSLAAAAQQLELSAPMVGKHLRFLESRLGSTLLSRTTRRQSLTEPGRHYYERCKFILDEVRAAESQAEAMHHAPRGHLRISAPVSLGTLCLAPAMATFLADHPEIQVELLLNDRVVDLVEDGFDVALRIGQLPDSRLVARALAPYAMVIAAAPAYLRRAGKPRTPSDLAHHQCLGFAHWRHRGGWPLEAHETSTFGPIPQPRLECNHGPALREAALQGMGVVMQPQVLLTEDLQAGRLIALLPDAVPQAKPVHLIYPLDRQPLPKLRAFIDFAVARWSHQWR